MTAAPQGMIEDVPAPTYPSLRKLHAYWLAKKGDRAAPPRSAIQPDEIVALLPNVALIDVVGNIPRFRFRLFGTGLVKAYGQDITGKFADEVDLDTIGPDIIAQFTKVVRECQPAVARIRFTKTGDHRYVQYERLALPLAETGTTVNMILLGYVPEKAF